MNRTAAATVTDLDAPQHVEVEPGQTAHAHALWANRHARGELLATHVHEVDEFGQECTTELWLIPADTEFDTAMGERHSIYAYTADESWLVFDATPTGDACPEIFLSEDEARAEYETRIEVAENA